MSTARARDGGRTQSGGVKGVVLLESGPEQPEPWLDLELVEHETDPDADDIKSSVTVYLCGLSATCACFSFLSFFPLNDTKCMLVCIVHMSVWQFCFSFVAFYYRFFSSVAIQLFSLPVACPSSRSPLSPTPSSAFLFSQFFFSPSSFQIHAYSTRSHLFVSLLVCTQKNCYCMWVWTVVCCRVVLGS